MRKEWSKFRSYADKYQETGYGVIHHFIGNPGRNSSVFETLGKIGVKYSRITRIKTRFYRFQTDMEQDEAVIGPSKVLKRSKEKEKME